MKTIPVEHFTDGIEYIITFRHLYRRKVSGSFRNSWFCCHNSFVIKFYLQKYMKYLIQKINETNFLNVKTQKKTKFPKTKQEHIKINPYVLLPCLFLNSSVKQVLLPAVGEYHNIINQRSQ